jgi:cation diffusion facilitator family transporter
MNSQPNANTPAGNLETGARVALLGMGANVCLATAKITAGALGHSYVLIADGIESSLDIAGSAIIWGGLKVAARPADETHPYGHGKAEPLAAIMVSLGVLAAALVLAVQSVREIFLPHFAPRPFTLVVLVVVVLVKEVLYRFVNRLGQKVESTAVQADAWHHRSDALTSVAAFVGISIALIGGPKWASADAWAALFACALIAANGWRLLSPAVHDIMDTAPRGEIVHAVCAAAAKVPGVLNVEKCLVRKMGLEFYVDLHLGVDETISVRSGHTIAHQVKDAIRRTDARIADVLVHVEPALPFELAREDRERSR